jgi:DNA-binding GntR family transcriptional regulator
LSAYTASVVGSLVHSTILMRTYQAFDDDAMHRSVEHHLELVAAVRARDPDWAECVMRSHLYSARAALLGSRSPAVPSTRPDRDPIEEDTA